MHHKCLPESLALLSEDFRRINWQYLDLPADSPQGKTQLWPGDAAEDIVICVANGDDTHEEFHRQNFFFLNFAYAGHYNAISYHSDNRITIHEGECYIGQPYAGYAIIGNSRREVIIGVLIQKEAFFKAFLPVLSTDHNLFRFFLNPQINQYSDEYIHLHFEDDFSVRTLLEMMVIEYANKKADTQQILKPLALALFMQVAREYKKSVPTPEDETLAEKIVRYMSEHTDVVTLKEIAAAFSYHPNYISSLLHRELGKTFSDILREQRMERATALLKGTALSIEEIAFMLGYSNTSNFYKAFRETFGISPREFVKGAG